MLVTTTQSLKLHGNVPETDIKLPNLEGLSKGLENLKRHVENLQKLGQTVVVGLNQFHFDTAEELKAVEDYCTQIGAAFARNTGFADGGDGAVDGDGGRRRGRAAVRPEACNQPRRGC